MREFQLQCGAQYLLLFELHPQPDKSFVPSFFHVIFFLSCDNFSIFPDLSPQTSPNHLALCSPQTVFLLLQSVLFFPVCSPLACLCVLPSPCQVLMKGKLRPGNQQVCQHSHILSFFLPCQYASFSSVFPDDLCNLATFKCWQFLYTAVTGL